ncbi:uncharacterized protein LOC119839960 [Zerene cesonia]|uniref:uncharacterized protein LOC119839960 n=1 Tax=Zerene cesonia TaxID=33412 RepID=UPI0018E4F9BD|nr:uncharacterized protein LOC119839960 [Zerene cesonia]
MESIPAAKVKNIKPMSKTKLKKTIKNVVCRPDPVTWPLASDPEIASLEAVLQKHCINIPTFKKLHWNEIKSIPKEKRPKPPPIKKVEGLLFGISECQNSIESGICSAILIESEVNPKVLVESLIEDCQTHSIPFICLKDLRKTSAINFGIATSCLGIKKNCLLDIQSVIEDIYEKKQPIIKEISITKSCEKEESMDMDTSSQILTYPYLHRKDKKTRVFSPSENTKLGNAMNKFSGQNFIEFSGSKKSDRKSYMNMILKRISNNPNRVKLKE